MYVKEVTCGVFDVLPSEILVGVLGGNVGCNDCGVEAVVFDGAVDMCGGVARSGCGDVVNVARSALCCAGDLIAGLACSCVSVVAVCGGVGWIMGGSFSSISGHSYSSNTQAPAEESGAGV